MFVVARCAPPPEILAVDALETRSGSTSDESDTSEALDAELRDREFPILAPIALRPGGPPRSTCGSFALRHARTPDYTGAYTLASYPDCLSDD